MIFYDISIMKVGILFVCDIERTCFRFDEKRFYCFCINLCASLAIEQLIS